MCAGLGMGDASGLSVSGSSAEVSFHPVMDAASAVLGVAEPSPTVTGSPNTSTTPLDFFTGRLARGEPSPGNRGDTSLRCVTMGDVTTVGSAVRSCDAITDVACACLDVAGESGGGGATALETGLGPTCLGGGDGSLTSPNTTENISSHTKSSTVCPSGDAPGWNTHTHPHYNIPVHQHR